MKHFWIALFVLCTQHLFSQAGGETLYSFLNTPTSPKQIALGGAVLTSVDDVSQALWNPSAISNNVSGDVAINYVNYIADISVGSLVFAKSINPKYGTAFLGVQYFDYGSFENTNASGPEIIGTFSPKEIAWSLGYAYTYQEVTFGAALKYVTSNIDTFSSSALLFDVGVTFIHPEIPLKAALSIRNSGKQLTHYLDRKEKIKNHATLSVEYQLKHVPFKFFGVLDDIGNWDISVPNPSNTKSSIDGTETLEKIEWYENLARHTSVGVELWSNKLINVRVGYNHRRTKEFQLEDVRTNAGLSYGFGINAKRFKFDYAFSKFQEGAKYSTFGLTLRL